MRYLNDESKSLLNQKIKAGKNFFQIIQATRAIGNPSLSEGVNNIQTALLNDKELCKKTFASAAEFESVCDGIAENVVLNFKQFDF